MAKKTVAIIHIEQGEASETWVWIIANLNIRLNDYKIVIFHPA